MVVCPWGLSQRHAEAARMRISHYEMLSVIYIFLMELKKSSQSAIPPEWSKKD